MTSQEILDLLKTLPPDVQAAMKKTVPTGKAIWFVNDETGLGKSCLFSGGCIGNAQPASTELCEYIGVPVNSLWIGDADHVEMPAKICERFDRHNRS